MLLTLLLLAWTFYNLVGLGRCCKVPEDQLLYWHFPPPSPPSTRDRKRSSKAQGSVVAALHSNVLILSQKTSSVQFSTGMQCSAEQWNAVQCNIIPCSAIITGCLSTKVDQLVQEAGGQWTVDSGQWTVDKAENMGFRTISMTYIWFIFFCCHDGSIRHWLVGWYIHPSVRTLQQRDLPIMPTYLPTYKILKLKKSLITKV